MRQLPRTSGVLVLGLLCACGGAGSSLAALDGTWWLTPSTSGIDEDPVHLSLVQSGTALGATATCRGDWPVGAGTWDGSTLVLAFDFGGGAVFVLSGSALGTEIVGTYAAPGQAGDFRLARNALALDCAHACDPVSPPRFVDVDWTELSKIEEVSLFRSSAGHDYSDSCEPCRSMKHYFAPYAAHLTNGDVAVRSPVAGQIISIQAEGHGASVGLENKQIRIRSTLHPGITFILFHVDLVAGRSVGDFVVAGDAIGTGRLVYPDLAEVAHDIDIAVRMHTPYGERYVSWFDVVTDALFATYVARGATGREDFLISAAARDADPLTCSGETFSSTGALPAWFVLGPP